MWSTEPLGRTGTISAAASAAAVGTFSNSKVTTSTPLREGANRVEVVVVGGDLEVGDLAGRRVFAGRQGVHAIAHAPRGDREHAPELAAAQHADGARRAE